MGMSELGVLYLTSNQHCSTISSHLQLLCELSYTNSELGHLQLMVTWEGRGEGEGERGKGRGESNKLETQ